MANFGNSFPAFWDSSLTQVRNVVASTTSVAGVSSTIEFVNAHEFQVGMMLKLNIVGGGSVFNDWVYVTSVFSNYFVLINYDLGTDSGWVGTATGYIGLERAKLTPNYIENDNIVHTSIITGKRNTIHKGFYSSFTVDVNLLNMDATLRVLLTRLLNSYNGSDVLFYPHVDKGYIKDSSGTGVNFNLSTSFNYLSSIDFRDLATLNFISQDYTNLTQNIG